VGLATRYLNVNHTKVQNHGLEIKITKITDITTLLLQILGVIRTGIPTQKFKAGN
jgi:hypothetical protein